MLKDFSDKHAGSRAIGEAAHVIFEGVLVSPWPDLLPNVIGRNR